MSYVFIYFKQDFFYIFYIKVYKEEIEALSENTDEPQRKSFNIYVKMALHLLNLLPIPIECSIDVCICSFNIKLI
jgi:hypothetical protein